MPRQSRQKGEFSIYHIIQRGNERKNLFLSDEDRTRFLDTVGRMKKKYNFLLYAYCLMDNHVHLLIDDNGNDISQILKSINISYEYYFNHVYQRYGHLFQDRFKSELVKDEGYLLEVSRYIHNNPVKAGITGSPLDYEWSSCSVYTGNRKNEAELIDTGRILNYFSCEASNAVKEYTEYVTRKENLEVEIMEAEDDILNDNSNSKHIFSIEQAQKRLEEMASDKGITLQVFLNDVKTRDEAIRQMRKNSSLTLKQLGVLFGGISESRMSRIAGRA